MLVSGSVFPIEPSGTSMVPLLCRYGHPSNYVEEPDGNEPDIGRQGHWNASGELATRGNKRFGL